MWCKFALAATLMVVDILVGCSSVRTGVLSSTEALWRKTAATWGARAAVAPRSGGLVASWNPKTLLPCVFAACAEGPLRLALRGGGYSIEDDWEGKDNEAWQQSREEFIQDFSVRDLDRQEWDNGDADADPTTMPFTVTRERLEVKPQNFSIASSLWTKDYLHENLEWNLPLEPPFKGKEWIGELEKVFDRLQLEWEEKQHDPSTADPSGPYHPRAGAFHKNPALDLTTSGTLERRWDVSRLSHDARMKAEAGNITTWRSERRFDEDDPDFESSLEAGTPVTTGVVDGQTRNAREGSTGFQPQYSAFRNFGEEDWGYSLALNGSMDANTDPWFRVNPDTETPTNPFEGDWVDKNLEEHFQRQLEKFSTMCREQNLQKRNESYAGRMVSAAPEEDALIFDCIDHTASVSYSNRLRSCPYANNKWVNNIGCMPSNTWNPETPIEKVSLWAKGKGTSFNEFKSRPRLFGIDGCNDGQDSGGWRGLGGDHLIHVEPEAEGQAADDEGGYDYGS